MTDQLPQVNVVTPQEDITLEVPVAKPEKKISPLLILVLITLLISVGAAGFIWLQPFKSPSTPPPVVITSPIPSAQPLTLTLASPSEDTLVVNQEVLVKGQTLPNTTVAIYTETDEELLESDASGMFESTVTLTEGINSLTVVAYGDDGEEKSQTLNLVYDSES